MRTDLISIATQLAKFGLNTQAAADGNSTAEQWEGLGLIPNLSTPASDDFHLSVGNDNDFLSKDILLDGTQVGASPFTQDNLILACEVVLACAITSVPPRETQTPRLRHTNT